MQQKFSGRVNDIYEAIGHPADELFCEVDREGCCCSVGHFVNVYLEDVPRTR